MRAKDTASFAVAGLGLTMAVPAYIWGGYVTATLWGWFISPLFGLPVITIAQAIGFGLVVSCFRWSVARASDLRKLTHPDEDATEQAIHQIVTVMVVPGMLLGVGWIVKEFFL